MATVELASWDSGLNSGFFQKIYGSSLIRFKAQVSTPNHLAMCMFFPSERHKFLKTCQFFLFLGFDFLIPKSTATDHSANFPLYLPTASGRSKSVRTVLTSVIGGNQTGGNRTKRYWDVNMIEKSHIQLYYLSRYEVRVLFGSLCNPLLGLFSDIVLTALYLRKIIPEVGRRINQDKSSLKTVSLGKSNKGKKPSGHTLCFLVNLFF